MARTLLTDDIWQQIQDTMRLHDCYRSKNSRNIMEAVLCNMVPLIRPLNSVL